MPRTLDAAERLYRCILVAAGRRRRADPCWEVTADDWASSKAMAAHEARCDAARAKHDRLVGLARRVLMAPHGWEA